MKEDELSLKGGHGARVSRPESFARPALTFNFGRIVRVPFVVQFLPANPGIS